MHLSTKATRLWAKKRSDDGEEFWYPLIGHLTDTQNVINWLFNHWLAPGQRELLIQGSSEEATQKLIKFLGFTHDIGKATPVFQKKPSYNGDREMDERLVEQLMRNGFTDLSIALLSSPQKSPHAKAGEAILEELGVPASVGAIVGAHHGKPLSHEPSEQIKNYTANYWQSENVEALQEPWKQVQRELLNYGLDTSGYQSQSVQELPSVTQPQAVILEGLLIMADWLASSEYLDNDFEKPLFPLLPLTNSWEDIDSTKRFRQAIRMWKLEDEWIPDSVVIDEKNDPYQQRWGFKGRAVQLTMTKAIADSVDPGMVIVEAGMGLGKTEIALVAAEQLAKKTGRDGVYMGLPTQATTNAMFSRVNGWLEQLAKNHAETYSTNLLHGKRQFNEVFTNLPSAENIDATDDEYGSVVVDQWFTGKKSILTKFTVGTIDNLLLMGLKQKHLFLRHLGFSGKVVIIDEVHAYDTYMNSYLKKVLQWLGTDHVPVIVLSATLPKEKRNELIIAYLKGKYGVNYKRELNAPVDWKETEAYPLLSIVDGNGINQITQFGPNQQQSTGLQVQRLNESDSELVQTILNKIQDGGIAGVIVNTVKRAQVLAKLVPTDTKLMILHSAFLAPDRARQEENLQATIGKNAKRPAKMIVIGTQVLEQSLDIDFDVLYTDIAPMDLILQRAGRLHRHEIKRPLMLKQPQIFILGINDFGDYGSANEAIYHKYLLMKTDHFLPETIELPTDISQLVQKVYEQRTDGEVSGLEEAKADFNSYLEQEDKKAKGFQIGSPSFRANKTIHGWLDRDAGSVDENEQSASAAVRDIQETLEVILIQHTSAGDRLLDGRVLTSVKDREIAEQTIRLPVAVTPRIDDVIEQLEKQTSRYFPEWQTSPWLRSALGLRLDDQFTAILGKWRLTYDSETGLSYEKEDEHGRENV